MSPMQCHSKKHRLDYDHGFLVNVIAKISTRFLCISQDKTLWNGDVFLELAESTEDGPRFPISTRDATNTLRFRIARCHDTNVKVGIVNKENIQNVTS